ncbi:hypothetical protein ACFGVR_01855 [Mucilaginibacter sp. AW1-3]
MKPKHMFEEKIKTSWLKLFTLVVAATVMAELLIGSTPLSRIGQLLPQFLFYGSGVILVREITRRMGLGWTTIILLGLAYGIIEEGLALQSIFNPHFLNLNISYGSAWGVNWVWAEYLTGFHCFWGMTGAILLCEEIYSADRDKPWVSLPVLWVVGCIYLLICVAFHALFVKLLVFQAALNLVVICLVIVILLITLALKLPQKQVDAEKNNVVKPVYSFWLIAFITFAAGVLWFLGIASVFVKDKVSLWISVPAGLVIVIIYFTLINKWKLMAIRNNIDRFAVVTGLLCAELVFGYNQTLANKQDHYGQMVLIVLVVSLLIILHKKSKKIHAVN